MISLGNRKRFVLLSVLYHDLHTSGVYATEPSFAGIATLRSERRLEFGVCRNKSLESILSITSGFLSNRPVSNAVAYVLDTMRSSILKPRHAKSCRILVQGNEPFIRRLTFVKVGEFLRRQVILNPYSLFIRALWVFFEKTIESVDGIYSCGLVYQICI